jgi:hypothetical protein
MGCLYCGKKPWWPFSSTGSGEFCGSDHREAYHGRLRKIAGELAVYREAPVVKPKPDKFDAILARASSVLASFLPMSQEMAAHAPEKRGPSAPDPLPTAFESHAKIKRWGLRMKFLNPVERRPPNMYRDR